LLQSEPAAHRNHRCRHRRKSQHVKEPSELVLGEHGGLHARTSLPDGDVGIVVCLGRKVPEVVP